MKRFYLFALAALVALLSCRVDAPAVDGGHKIGSLVYTPGANVVTREQFLAKGDGSTNDSAAMTSAISAIASGGTIQLGCGKTYLIGASSPYILPASTSLVGCGQGSVLKTATNAALLRVGGEDVSISNLKLLGNATGSSQYGIANRLPGAGTHYGRFKVSNIIVDSFGEAGIILDDDISDNPPPLFASALINVSIINCPTYGLWNLDDYSTTTNLQVDNCGEGVRAQAGNEIYVGGSITDSTTGFHLVGGGNDAHGSVTGTLINHNTTNLLVDNATTNTEHFVNCAFYGSGSSISLVSSHDVYFDSCQFDVDNYYFDGSIGTVFRGCTWPNNSATNIVNNNFNAHASTTFADSWNVDLNGNASSVVAKAGWGWGPRNGKSAVVIPTDANYTATAADYSNQILSVTSSATLTATRNVVLPVGNNASYIVFNNTTGAQSIQFIGTSGTGITVATGKRATIYFDGTNFVRVTADT